jgi:hypothetical protein
MAETKSNLNLLVDEMNRKNSQQRNADDRQRNRDEVVGAFGVYEGFARLTGQTQATSVFSQAGKLAGSVHDLAALSNIQAYFKAHPMKMMNLYLMAADMGLSMLQQGQGDPQMAAIMGQLEEIKKLLEDLKKLMIERFDQIDRSLSNMLVKIEIGNRHIIATVDVIKRTINELAKRMDGLDQAVHDNFQAEAEVQLTDWFNKCLRTTNSPSMPLPTARAAQNCLSHYLLIGAGRFPPAANIVDNRLSSAEAKENFKNLLSTITLSNTVRDAEGESIMRPCCHRIGYSARIVTSQYFRRTSATSALQNIPRWARPKPL